MNAYKTAVVATSLLLWSIAVSCAQVICTLEHDVECALPQSVAVFGDTDRRKTVSEFAGEVNEPVETIRQRFAATGILICKASKFNWEGSAQLTNNARVITTAAHLLRDGRHDACSAKLLPQSCRFTIDGPRGVETYQVEKLAEEGWDCSKHVEKARERDNDWAVLLLTRPVIGVKPYRIQPTAKFGGKLLSVCHSIDFQRRAPKSDILFPKHIEFCQTRGAGVRDTPTSQEIVTWFSDCDSSGYCSGGSILDRNSDDPVLRAITVGSRESEQLRRQALKSGRPNFGEYDLNKWSTQHVPINPEFFAAIVRASSNIAP